MQFTDYVYVKCLSGLMLVFLQKYSKGNSVTLMLVNNFFVFLKEKKIIKGLVW